MSRFYGYLRVFYPCPQGELILRTEQDWDRDVEAHAVDSRAQRHDFLIAHDRPYLFCKPCIRRDGKLHWAEGTNKLVILGESPQDCYPHFFSGKRGQISPLLGCPSEHLGRTIYLRIYLPAGYGENPLKRYPVLYMHDGKNLFFPEEAFLGSEWKIDENLDLLDSMSLVDRTVVVGVYASDRMSEYTLPGYEAYGRALTEEVKPWVDGRVRTLRDSQRTAIMGSSLGGVVSMYCGWQYPQTFGTVACLSSTFGYRDNLLERVRSEPIAPRTASCFYLDSGWPGDNYEVTLTMANALLERGLERNRRVLHLAFPLATHSEASWRARVHIPLQLFSGKTRRTGERHAMPYATAPESAQREWR